MAYQVELLAKLSDVHNVFHVSQFKKCLRVHEEQLPLEEMDIKNDLTYEESLAKTPEIAERITRSKTIRMCKVQWKHHSKEEATWEREDELKADYPQLFLESS